MWPDNMLQNSITTMYCCRCTTSSKHTQPPLRIYRSRLGPCTGLKFRPRPGPQIWFEAQARPGPAAVVQTRPANWIMRPGPQKVCTGPQHNCYIWGPARARGLRAGPLARPHIYTTKTGILLLCTHSNVTGLLSWYVHKHMHFQCLCEV